jgi:hypothetical protein
VTCYVAVITGIDLYNLYICPLMSKS